MNEKRIQTLGQAIPPQRVQSGTLAATIVDFMRFIKAIILVAILLASISCSTTSKMLRSNVNPEEISSILYFEPISYIYSIESGNKSYLNDSFSNVVQVLLTEISEGLFDEINLKYSYYKPDTVIQKFIDENIETLIKSVNRYGNLYHWQTPATIDSILKSKNFRFGLLPVIVGFTRTKSNYYKQYYKGEAIRALTLGVYSETPIPCYSTLYLIILDSNDNNVTFYRKSENASQPYLPEPLNSQYREIFKGYFLKKK